MESFMILFASWMAVSMAFPTDMSTGPLRIFERADAYQWTALGDSYASGVGAGTMDQGSQRCMRFSDAYPRLMNSSTQMPGSPNRVMNNVVCSGAQSQDVLDQQFYDIIHYPSITDYDQYQYGPRPPFGVPQIATLSIGGNDIDLKGLIFNCIFQFWPTMSCEDQRTLSWSKLNSPDLVNNIEAVVNKAMTKGQSGPAGQNFRLYVTGYGQMFNADTTQCNDVTFSVWGTKWPGNNVKLTQERRADFNAMAAKLNQVIQGIVTENLNGKVTFIPWDDALDGGEGGGHRYCEDRTTEPDRNNPDIWLWNSIPWLWYTSAQTASTSSDVNGAFLDAFAKKIDPSVANWAALAAKYGPPNGDAFTGPNFTSPNGRTTDDIYNFLGEVAAESTDTDLVEGAWAKLAQVFRVCHPTTDLHQIISQRVLDKVVADLPPAAPVPLPIPAGQTAGCGADWPPAGFPTIWDLTIGQHSANDIYYSMRDQACQGLCQNLAGIDPQYVKATRMGDTGCEYAAKLTAKNEMYFYATGSGQNCYDATMIAINQCTATKDAGWVNGPNYGEFYQVGIRDLNGQGSVHTPFADDGSHIPYEQVVAIIGPVEWRA